MPVYCYRCPECRAPIERTYPMGHAAKSLKCACGKRAVRDLLDEHARHRNTPGNYPMVSDAAGCHPDQIKEFYDESVAAGIPTDFNSEGQAIFRSKGHRRDYLEHCQIYDRNGGYSDPQRG